MPNQSSNYSQFYDLEFGRYTRTEASIWATLYLANILAIIVANALLIGTIGSILRDSKHCNRKAYTAKSKVGPPTNLIRIEVSSAGNKPLDQGVILMNYQLIFLCAVDLIAGLVCFPMFTVLNFPRVFLPGEFHDFENGSLVYSRITNDRMCRLQIAFTFFSCLGGFGSGFGMTLLARNRYTATRMIASPNYLFERLLAKLRLCRPKDQQNGNRVCLISSSCRWNNTWPFNTNGFVMVMLITATIATSLPVPIFMGSTRVGCNLEPNTQIAFLWYTTIIGMIVPLLFTLTYYFLAMMHLKEAYQRSLNVLRSKASARRNIRAFHMILAIFTCHLMVGLPLVVINFFEINGRVNSQSPTWRKFYATETLNLLMAFDRWADAVIIYYFGRNLRKKVTELLRPTFNWLFNCPNVSQTLKMHTKLSPPNALTPIGDYFNSNLPVSRAQCLTTPHQGQKFLEQTPNNLPHLNTTASVNTSPCSKVQQCKKFSFEKLTKLCFCPAMSSRKSETYSKLCVTSLSLTPQLSVSWPSLAQDFHCHRLNSLAMPPYQIIRRALSSIPSDTASLTTQMTILPYTIDDLIQ